VYDNHLPDCEANIARLALFAQQTRGDDAPPAQYAHGITSIYKTHHPVLPSQVSQQGWIKTRACSAMPLSHKQAHTVYKL
jgi:hypothetical protein